MSATLNSEMFSSYFGTVIQLAFHFFFVSKHLGILQVQYSLCCLWLFFLASFFWVLDIHHNCLARSASLPREHVSSYKVASGLTHSGMMEFRVSLIAKNSLRWSDMLVIWELADPAT